MGDWLTPELVRTVAEVAPQIGTLGAGGTVAGVCLALAIRGTLYIRIGSWFEFGQRKNGGKSE